MNESMRQSIEVISWFVIPALLVFFPLYGLLRRVPVYERFVEGAREGFTTAVRIIPYLVAIIVAIGMFRASGAMEQLTDWLRSPMRALGVPPEILPMAIVRPLSGSGSLAVLGDMVKQYGTDAVVTRIAAVIFGSAETTFYVIAVYFGAVSIRKTRHAVPAGLIADAAGVILAVYVVKWFMGQ
jgi:spore maturation protein B